MFGWQNSNLQLINASTILSWVDDFGHIHYGASGVYDMGSFITPVNSNTIYFKTTFDRLHYYQKTGSTWHEQAANINHQTNNPITDCGGAVCLANNTIWYRSTLNSLKFYNPANGILTAATGANTMAGNGLVVAQCGCIAFYRNTSHQLVQYCKQGNQNNTMVVVSNGIVSDYLALDETNNRVYFIGIDGAVYYYTYSFNTLNTNALTRLEGGSGEKTNNATICSQYRNAGSGLTLSYDKSMIYYRDAVDGNIWYYFNDKENSYNTSLQQAISNPNWNKSCISSFGPLIGGPIALEASATGRLFYAGGSSPNYNLHKVDWIDADIPVGCLPGGTPPFFHDTKSKPTGDSLHNLADTLMQINVSVFPNPSNNTFTITVMGIQQAGDIQISICGIDGTIMYNKKGSFPGGSTDVQQVWDAANVADGIYFYAVKLPGGKMVSGKLVKM